MADRYKKPGCFVTLVGLVFLALLFGL